MTRTLLVAFVAVLLSSGARAAPARDAGALMDTGLAAYQAGDYAAAIGAFRAAYEIDERPAALFAIAQAERKSGDCAAAIVDYDRFLATSPSERQAQAARDQRQVCADQLTNGLIANPVDPSTKPAPAPAPAPRAQPLPRPAPPPAAAAPPWYRDPLTDGLVGGAALGAGLGLGFTLASSSAASRANAATTYADHQQAADAMARDRDLAIASFATAAVLGGVAAWRIVRHDADAHADRVAIVPGPGLGLAITGGL